MHSGGDELLEFVRELGELEWSKCVARWSDVCGDQSRFGPSTSFRFKGSVPAATIDRLREGVLTYQGPIQWTFSEHVRRHLGGINYGVWPRKFDEVFEEAFARRLTSAQYLAATCPEFGAKAFDDLSNLVEFLRILFAAS